jgi:hypothetical protein
MKYFRYLFVAIYYVAGAIGIYSIWDALAMWIVTK